MLNKSEILPALEKFFEDFKIGNINIDLFKEIKVFDQLNPEVINSLGWVECFFTCGYVPKDKAVGVFDSYMSFKTNKKHAAFIYSEAIPLTNKKTLFFDEVANCYFLSNFEPSIRVWKDINDNKLVNTCASSIGKVFTTNVARNIKFNSTFDTGFLDHSSADRKNFNVPKGECFGVEIEMLFADVFGKLRFSHWIKNNFNKWICERDGSLEDRGDAKDCGLELVSPPLSQEDLNSQIKIICAEALKHGGRGHDAGIWYGMHINVNIYDQKPDITAAKFMCLINDPNLRSFWKKICRRRGASVERFCQFQDINLKNCLLTESENHYRATFYRNGKNCVEVRIFRSNLRYLTVKLSVEILKHTLDFCMTDNNFNDYIKYREYLVSNASNDLQEYLYYMKAMSELDKLVSSIKHKQFENISITNYIA